MKKILIIDDDLDFCWTLQEILKNSGYETKSITEGKRALQEVKKYQPNLILLDQRLKDINGIELMQKLKEVERNLVVIMITAYGATKSAVEAMKLGAFDYITKPFDNDELLLIIKKALETQSLSEEIDILRRRFEEESKSDEIDLIGNSQPIRYILNQVRTVAPTNMTVLLRGESGTGKELIAELIHRKSQRKDKPFVVVDCGALPDSLFESELFGYEKGAFTGANFKKEGYFELANGGTIFLDEIGNLTQITQTKLLRVLQERKIRPLGGKKIIDVDVRIISATNKNLEESIKDGSFRTDLFHRLNEFAIYIPPLRERKDDIPVLAKHFIKEANREFNKNIEGLSSKAMRYILEYHWPGNVRELKNLIKRAVLLANKIIMLENLSINSEIYPYFCTLDADLYLERGLSFFDITKKFVEPIEAAYSDESGH
ncbi:MAG: sigma-54 dependent transcriptional regulator [Acidobacteriota bacterium]